MPHTYGESKAAAAADAAVTEEMARAAKALKEAAQQAGEALKEAAKKTADAAEKAAHQVADSAHDAVNWVKWNYQGTIGPKYGPTDIIYQGHKEDLLTGDEQDTGDTGRSVRNTFALMDRFIYVDLGKWGGKDRTFALICGNGDTSEVLLCEFTPAPGCSYAPVTEAVTKFLSYPAFKGYVSVSRHFTMSKGGLDTNNKLYVLIGDLHLPVVSQSEQDASAVPGRIIVEPMLGDSVEVAESFYVSKLTGKPEKIVLNADPRVWLGLYNTGDIFKDAGASLCQFVAGLKDFFETTKTPIHFVQAGDFYDQWIGLERLYDETTSKEVVFRTSPSTGRPGQEMVREWIRLCNRNIGVPGFGSLPDHLHNCGLEATWLYGNHDCYMITLAEKEPVMPGDPPQRHRLMNEGSILALHGHVYHPDNWDGVAGGHEITQDVLFLWYVGMGMRHLEWLPRESYIKCAAIRYLAGQDKSKWKVFVMAHTHEPFMSSIWLKGASPTGGEATPKGAVGSAGLSGPTSPPKATGATTSTSPTAKLAASSKPPAAGGRPASGKPGAGPWTPSAVQQKPRGEGDYVVKPGDCLSSIAYEYGMTWQTLYKAQCADFRDNRDPNVIFPGDRLTIPGLTQKDHSGQNEARHTFVLKGVPEKFQIRIVERDDIPVVGTKYLLIIDGDRHDGQTDADGWIRVPISPDAEGGKLILPELGREWPVRLGHLDPLETISGVQARLNNLGFPSGPVDGIMGPKTKAGIRAFQRVYGLQVDGIAGPKTLGKMKEMYGT